MEKGGNASILYVDYGNREVRLPSVCVPPPPLYRKYLRSISVIPKEMLESYACQSKPKKIMISLVYAWTRQLRTHSKPRA